jgi:hypothetical protein
MKATELIAQLQDAVARYGDLHVVDHRDADLSQVEHQVHDDDTKVPDSFVICTER